LILILLFSVVTDKGLQI